MVSNVFQKITDTFGNTDVIKSVINPTSSTASNEKDKQEVNNKIMLEILRVVQASNKSIKSTKDALEPLTDKGGDILKNLLTDIKNVEKISDDFLKKGKTVSSEDTQKMLDMLDKVSLVINKNLDLKLGNETLQSVLTNFRVKNNQNTLLNSSIFDSLAKLSNKIGTSAEDYLISNAGAISGKTIAGDLSLTALSAISPQLGLIAKSLEGVVDFGSLFDNSKDFIGNLFKKDKTDSYDNEEATRGTTVESTVEDNTQTAADNSYSMVESLEVIHSEIEGLRSDLTTQAITNEDEENDKYKKTLKQLKRIEDATKDIDAGSSTNILGTGGLLGGLGNFLKGAGGGFFGANTGAGKAGKYGRVLGKGLGLASSAAFLYGSTDISDKKGQGLFGDKENGGLLNSRAADYAQGALGGAQLGAIIGGPIGAAIGAVGGLITTAIMDYLPEITEAFEKVGHYVKDKFIAAYGRVKAYFTDIVDGFKDFFEDPLKQVKEVLTMGFDKVMSFFNFVSEKFDSLKSGITGSYFYQLIFGDKQKLIGEGSEEANKSSGPVRFVGRADEIPEAAPTSTVVPNMTPIPKPRDKTVLIPSEHTSSVPLVPSKKSVVTATQLQMELADKNNMERFNKGIESVWGGYGKPRKTTGGNSAMKQSSNKRGLNDTVWNIDDAGLMAITSGGL